jgi:hypothetical protein
MAAPSRFRGGEKAGHGKNKREFIFAPTVALTSRVSMQV